MSRYELHTQMEERRTDLPWGSARYKLARLYKILDADAGTWIFRSWRKADTMKTLKALKREEEARRAS